MKPNSLAPWSGWVGSSTSVHTLSASSPPNSGDCLGLGVQTVQGPSMRDLRLTVGTPSPSLVLVCFGWGGLPKTVRHEIWGARLGNLRFWVVFGDFGGLGGRGPTL